MHNKASRVGYGWKNMSFVGSKFVKAKKALLSVETQISEIQTQTCNETPLQVSKYLEIMYSLNKKTHDIKLKMKVSKFRFSHHMRKIKTTFQYCLETFARWEKNQASILSGNRCQIHARVWEKSHISVLDAPQRHCRWVRPCQRHSEQLRQHHGGRRGHGRWRHHDVFSCCVLAWTQM